MQDHRCLDVGALRLEEQCSSPLALAAVPGKAPAWLKNSLKERKPRWYQGRTVSFSIQSCIVYPNAAKNRPANQAGRSSFLLGFHATGLGGLSRQPVQNHRLIQPVATGEVETLEAALGQNPAGQIAAQATLADHVYGLLSVQLSHPLP